MLRTANLALLLFFFFFSFMKCSYFDFFWKNSNADCNNPLLNGNQEEINPDDSMFIPVKNPLQYVEEDSSNSDSSSYSFNDDLTSSYNDLSIESFVPARKVEAGVVVCFYLLLFKLVWPPSSDHFTVLEIVIFAAILHVMQLYIGYNIKTCPFKIEPVKYKVSEGLVSYNRWILCPLAWITEIVFIFVEPFLTNSQKLIFLYLFVPQMLFILGVIKKC